MKEGAGVSAWPNTRALDGEEGVEVREAERKELLLALATGIMRGNE